MIFNNTIILLKINLTMTTCCSICIEPFSNEKVILECNHEFCKDCLKEYLEYTIKKENKNSIDCPNCRQSIKETGNVEIDEIVNNLSKKEIIDSSYDIMLRLNSIMGEIINLYERDMGYGYFNSLNTQVYYTNNLILHMDGYINNHIIDRQYYIENSNNRIDVIENYLINLTNRGSTLNMVRIVKNDTKIRKDNNKFYTDIKLPKLKFNKRSNFQMKKMKNFKCMR